MKQYLQNIFNEHKNAIVEVICTELKVQGDKVFFNPPIRIDLPDANDEDFETITEIELDEKESHWYVHNYITYIDLMTSEYWTPLRDLSFEELYEIAEKL